MISKNNLLRTIFIFSLFIFPSTNAISESDTNKNTYEKQKVHKLESGRTNELKSDADLRGRTEENKGNFDSNVPRDDGVQYPPAKGTESSIQDRAVPAGKGY